MDLRKVFVRALSGLVYCAIIIGCIFWGFKGVTLLAITFCVLGSIELTKMSHDLNSKTMPGLLLDIIGCIFLCFGYLGYPVLLWGVVMICRFVLELYVQSEHPVRDLSRSMFVQIYVGFPMAIMTGISFLYNPMPLLAVFFLLWINDTGAFLVGSMMGKHKLFERISPKKTWEGFWGGFIFCLIASSLFYYYGNGFFRMNMLSTDLVTWLILGALVSVFGTWGDLIESLIKRNMQVKDSGNLIPGHGGILDRIDSLLLVLPVFLLYLVIISFY